MQDTLAVVTFFGFFAFLLMLATGILMLAFTYRDPRKRRISLNLILIGLVMSLVCFGTCAATFKLG